MTFKVKFNWVDTNDESLSLVSSTELPFGLKIEVHMDGDNVFVPYITDGEYDTGLTAEFSLDGAKKVAEEYVTYEMLKFVERF